MTHQKSGRPRAGEFAAYAAEDIAFVPGDDAILALHSQGERIGREFGALDDAAVAGVRYAPGKWTVKEILGHLVDDERIFLYRMLTVARGDSLALPGFDENLYVSTAGFETRAWAELLKDYRVMRKGTLRFLGGLPTEAWDRQGMVNGYAASVRGLAFHVAGHELHHLRVLEERYRPLLPSR